MRAELIMGYSGFWVYTESTFPCFGLHPHRELNVKVSIQYKSLGLTWTVACYVISFSGQCAVIYFEDFHMGLFGEVKHC